MWQGLFRRNRQAAGVVLKECLTESLTRANGRIRIGPTWVSQRVLCYLEGNVLHSECSQFQYTWNDHVTDFLMVFLQFF